MVHYNKEAVGSFGSVLVFVVFLLCPLQTVAQWVEPDSLTSILNLRQEFTDVAEDDSSTESVAISGIANVPSGLLHENYLQIYLQNDSAGIPIFGYQIIDPVDVGDSVVVKGTKQYYFGQPELLVEEYKVYPNNQAGLEPVSLFEAFQKPGQYLGMLAEGTGIIREKGTRFNGKYVMIAPSDTASQTVMVYVSNFHAAYQDFDFETPGIGDAITVKGIVGQYDPAFPEGTTYKLFLRTPDDFSYASWPQYYYKILAIILIALILVAGAWMLSLRTQVKRKTRALERSLEEKDVLIQEIHHRVKNNMAAISGLLELQSGRSDNPEVQRSLQESKSRINSMMIVHEKLYQSLSFKRIQMQPYLRELADSIHKTFSDDTQDIEIIVEAEGVELNTDQVIPIGLLVNELLVNAFKHAFDDREQGKIWISLKENERTATLRVEDNGTGLPDEQEVTKSGSLGMLLINAFADQLQAEKTIKNTPGACFIFEFSIEDR